MGEKIQLASFVRGVTLHFKLSNVNSESALPRVESETNGAIDLAGRDSRGRCIKYNDKKKKTLS